MWTPYTHRRVTHCIHNLTEGTLYFFWSKNTNSLDNEGPLGIQDLQIHPFTNMHKAISEEPNYYRLPSILTHKSDKEKEYKIEWRHSSIITLKHSLFSTTSRAPNEMSTATYLGTPYSQFIFLSFFIHKMDGVGRPPSHNNISLSLTLFIFSFIEQMTIIVSITLQ